MKPQKLSRVVAVGDGRAWTKAHDEQMLRLYARGWSILAIAIRMGKSEGAVASHLRQLQERSEEAGNVR